ncbi:MAG: hypothetical protein ACFB8W_21065 [Elainellaceae cyanobacterium]
MSSFRVDAFPYELPKPLERLNVYDGLILNAERWEVSQSYVRQRQNVHFQSASQSGIVCGLGVKVIPAPTWSRARTREQDAQRQEQRWLEIQPGVAIDAAGNPIIVGSGDERDRTFRIATAPPTTGTMTVHVVARYVEPATTAGADRETLSEQYRFEEKTDPPDALDVELCRFQLTPGPIRLALPPNVFAPRPGELDLRHRQAVQLRATATLRLGFVGPFSPKTYEDFDSLNRAMKVLRPDMQLDLEAAAVSLQEGLPMDRFDALVVPAQEFQPLLRQHLRWIEAFVNDGGTLLVETPSDAVPVFSPQAQQVFQALTPWDALKPTHSLRTDPFLFTQLPAIGGQKMGVAIANGLVWVGGSLSSAWGVYQSLSRTDIRTAHELGINVLRYIWRRRHLTGLVQWQV